MIKRIILLALFAPAVLGAAAQGYRAHAISDELTRGANAVVRHCSVEYDYKSKTSAVEKHTVAVTVLNSKGDDAAELMIYTNGNRSVRSFSGEIFGASGASLRKVKRSDLIISEQSSGLADDGRIHYYEPHVPAYPYTVKYTYEIAHRDGILFFPVFMPVEQPAVSLEKASYTLRVPSGTRIHTRNMNTDITPRKNGADQDTYVWSLENLPPITMEPYGPPFRDLAPRVYASPHEFSYNGIEGVGDTWENYAKWQWRLLEGRQALPAPLRDEIARMTAGAQTDMEKIRVLYDYLAATTRYVSIQIGIGGLQPMTAEQVYNRKFGDCKALSNYMQAMLAECGIASHYVEIGVRGRDIIPDFVSPLLSNHAILAVPREEGGMLWLECTAPELPLGFVHEDIAGQNALIYKDGGAYIEKVPVYSDSLHLSAIEGRVKVAADGSMTGRVSRTDACNRYDDRKSFGKMDARERANYLQNGINLPLTEISGVVFAEDKSPEPSCTTGFDITKKALLGEIPDRFFIESSPFRRSPVRTLGRSARRTDIVVKSGFRNVDRITLEVDAGLEVEALPAPVSIASRYGEFTRTVSLDDGLIRIVSALQINSGEYPASEYADFKSFIDAVGSGYSSKIVLKRK